jgi:hypothetical protein
VGTTSSYPYSSVSIDVIGNYLDTGSWDQGFVVELPLGSSYGYNPYLSGTAVVSDGQPATYYDNWKGRIVAKSGVVDSSGCSGLSGNPPELNKYYLSTTALDPTTTNRATDEVVIGTFGL